MTLTLLLEVNNFTLICTSKGFPNSKNLNSANFFKLLRLTFSFEVSFRLKDLACITKDNVRSV